MLQKNQILTYLLYAIGEIVLVVVGILIAVQIDDWNEDRPNAKKEVQLLRDLHGEFLKNRDKLLSTIKINETCLEAISATLKLIGEPETVLQDYNLDSLVFLSIEYDDFNPSQSVVLELISSGKINLITSDSLRMFIFDWVAAMDEEAESYASMDQIGQSIFLPYLAKNGSMKNLDYYGLLSKNGKSKFKSTNQLLFQQREFENNLDNQAWGISNYLIRLHVLETLNEALLSHTDQPSQ